MSEFVFEEVLRRGERCEECEKRSAVSVARTTISAKFYTLHKIAPAIPAHWLPGEPSNSRFRPTSPRQPIHTPRCRILQNYIPPDSAFCPRCGAKVQTDRNRLWLWMIVGLDPWIDALNIRGLLSFSVIAEQEAIEFTALQQKLAAKEAECKELHKQLHELRGSAQILQNRLSVAEMVCDNRRVSS
jgi:hypothetical protein